MANRKTYMRDYMRAARNKRYYEKNKKKYNDKVVQTRHKLKDMAVEYLGGVCSRCGQSFDPVCMDFHHKDHKQKDFNIAIGFTNKSWPVIQKELDKCILVCSNCHRIIHKEDKYLHLQEKPDSPTQDNQTSFF